MTEDILQDTKNHMKAALEHFQQELRAIRAGRASPALLENILVEAYGTTMHIRELGTITSPEPRQLLITPFDITITGNINKAIEKANIGVRSAIEGKMIRIFFPELDMQRRKELVSQVNKKKEEGKVAIRNCRHKSNDLTKKLKTDNLITEDDVKRIEKHIQELTDKSCKEIDDITHAKEKEIMEI